MQSFKRINYLKPCIKTTRKIDYALVSALPKGNLAELNKEENAERLFQKRLGLLKCTAAEPLFRWTHIELYLILRKPNDYMTKTGTNQTGSFAGV